MTKPPHLARVRHLDDKRNLGQRGARRWTVPTSAKRLHLATFFLRNEKSMHFTEC